MRYKFKVGLFGHRTITVEAGSVEEADLKARETLDLLAERRGKEAPVRWDLKLIKE